VLSAFGASQTDGFGQHPDLPTTEPREPSLGFRVSVMTFKRRLGWAVGATLTATVAGCSIYGANFDYPSAAPVPAGASVVLTDKGWDDDDPIRSRVQVIDAGGTTVDGLRDFYRDAYPRSDGWMTVDSEGQELCLVNRTNDDYTQVLDVTRYEGSRVTVQPDRHLVVVSRIEHAPRRPCGVAAAWIPMNLL